MITVDIIQAKATEVLAWLNKVEEKYVEQKQMLEYASQAIESAKGAMDTLNELKGSVVKETDKINTLVVLNAALEKTKAGLEEEVSKLTGQHSEVTGALSQVTNLHKELLGAKAEVETNIEGKAQAHAVLTADCEALKATKESIIKDNARLLLEKEGLKRNIAIFSEREHSAGTLEDRKKILTDTCEEDEEVRIIARISNPSQPFYYISKKSVGAPQTDVDLDPGNEHQRI